MSAPERADVSQSEEESSRLYDVMRWIQNRMIDACGRWEDGEISTPRWAVTHVAWWSVGMVVVSVCAGAIALAETLAKIRERISHRGARA